MSLPERLEELAKSVATADPKDNKLLLKVHEQLDTR